ncbi:dystrophin-like [Saccoglossus kowalevskii]|uniref:Dystrophin, isoforms A/C/F/G/H-like n=1 Tax=Saccoglossus kowalevskii TaxID=10224 RepID=A0ABM0MWD7_SACKO|nr:PREDICTED: dystrophin, isoforms A/C/F/G/H-like [Saccoglossus kowalevskii]
MNEERDYGLEGWDRSETNSGIPYYINHYTERTQWDHPNFVKFMQYLDTFNNIQYGAYRAAVKLRAMQKFLKFHVVAMSTIRSVFEQHGFRDRNDSVMDIMDLLGIITDIYYMTKQMMPKLIDVPLHSDLLLNWILNLYDIGRTGCIRVLSVKIGLVVMSAATITDKYLYLCEQLCDLNGTIGKKSMTAFMQDMMAVVDAIYEVSVFGGYNVNSSVTSAFESCMGSVLMQESFMKWLMAEPETLVWLPTMHRLSTAETMKHEVKCNICKAFPVVGFRYKCLKCFNFDLCQECFFTNRSSKNHKHSHPVQEFVVAASTKDDAKAFARTVRNRFSKKHRRRFKLNYLPIPPTSDYDSSYETDLNRSDSEMHSKIGKLSKRLAEVEETSAPVKVDKPQQTDASLMTDYVRHHSQYSSKTSIASVKEVRELKDLIEELERENRRLVIEVERLRNKDASESDVSRMTAEHWMEQHDELKAKQEILEEHNKQLDLQLRRLRLLLSREPRLLAQTSLSPPSPGIRPDSHRRLKPTSRRPLDISAPAFLHTYQSPAGQSRQSTQAYDTIDSRLYPPHLVNQSTVHYPEVNASKMFPSEEAELDDLLRRLDSAYPLNTTDSHYHGDGNDMMVAAQKVGEAMTSLVSRATRQYAE